MFTRYGGEDTVLTALTQLCQSGYPRRQLNERLQARLSIRIGGGRKSRESCGELGATHRDDLHRKDLKRLASSAPPEFISVWWIAGYEVA